MVKGIFCTTAPLISSHGGGNVSLHELNALRQFCDEEVLSFSTTDLGLSQHPNPFITDFVVSNKVEGSYDIVHFNGHPWGRTLRALRYHNSSIKVISSVPAHDLELSIDEFHRHGIDYESTFPHMVDPVLWKEYTEHDQKADIIIYPSYKSRDYFVKKLGLTNRSEIIPHGCNIPTSNPSYPSEFTVGYIGAGGPDKGLIYLFKAFHGLKYDDAKLVLFGRKWNESSIRGMKNVECYGKYKDLEEIMPKFSIGVFLSVTEGFNIGALECMAMSKPIIVSEGAGVSELIVDGWNGFIVPIRDVALTQRFIHCLKTTGGLIEEMGRYALETAKQYTWDKIEEQYVEIYRSLFK